MPFEGNDRTGKALRDKRNPPNTSTGTRAHAFRINRLSSKHQCNNEGLDSLDDKKYSTHFRCDWHDNVFGTSKYTRRHRRKWRSRGRLVEVVDTVFLLPKTEKELRLSIACS